MEDKNDCWLNLSVTQHPFLVSTSLSTAMAWESRTGLFFVQGRSGSGVCFRLKAAQTQEMTLKNDRVQ